jgi:hypothetical protein
MVRSTVGGHGEDHVTAFRRSFWRPFWRKIAGAAAELEGRGTVRGHHDQTGRRLRCQSCAGGFGIPGDDLTPLPEQGCFDGTSQGGMVRKQQHSNRHAVSWSSCNGFRPDKL